jgi:hypothetical protein
MEADDRAHKLLEEIRDVQREHLTEYRRVTQQLLELQQRAVARPEHRTPFFPGLCAITARGTQRV